MRGTRMFRWSLGAAFCLAALGCGGSGDNGGKPSGGPKGGAPAGAAGEKRLTGAGSTFVNPMMSKWSKEYEQSKGVRVDYQSIGSGGGIKQLIAKTVEFGCSDGPMNEGQLKDASAAGGDVVHIPLAMGGVVPAYNVPGVEGQLHFSGEVLADIFLGKITKWNDPAIADLNKDANLPDSKIVVVHRSDGSGTTYIFVDYLSKVSKEWQEKVGRATSVNWPTGLGEKGNEGVAGQVSRSPGSIGYVELIYAMQNKISYGKVRNKEGAFVAASLESVSAAAAASLTDIPEDLRYSITDASGKESYPISGTVWAIVFTKPKGDRGADIREFLNWCTHDGQQFCDALHYARLPKGLVERLEKRLALIQ